MAQYHLAIEQANQQYIQFKVIFEHVAPNSIIHLPKWRPGRYELGNFAKNVRGFKVFDMNGKVVSFHKSDLSSWTIELEETTTIRVEYSYYAAELNAGSTYLTKEMLYSNPVNCFVYQDGKKDEACEVFLNIPANWNVACSMEREGNRLRAANFDELADSPFICSPSLQYNQYESHGTIFHLWFQGDCMIEWSRLIKDFKAFTDKQIEKFMEFPVPHYHFLFHILPYKAYHGVEHQKSTVISLGPTYDVFGALYTELLGVSSHELYHTWNVKAIRPIEMYPYDYQTENLSKLGYLCEGVTTYMGDLMLYKSGVFDLEQYLHEFTGQLQKHFDNFGRFHYSVADSSYDTWLDGYAPGAPGRKVSIYTEGCLLAFVCDVKIREHSGNKHGLDELMKRLYFNFALENKGVSEEDYISLLKELAGDEIETLIKDYFYGTRPFEAILTEALEALGLELTHKPNHRYSVGRIGFKSLAAGAHFHVSAIYPGSPADLAGLMINDEIIAVNDFKLNGDLDNWLSYLDDQNKHLTVIRQGKIIELSLPEVQRSFYLEYGVKVIETPNSFQKKAFECWSK
ncbi:PDZ domain-containing protein [Fluviicola sp.]|uniref:M61 family metallopeptidase n=1 Tax=Fluviicola sp. TaxID=1917219 RepID=UPI0026174B6B|nr:PDZ domain-containing protein [Fluviicola sp.]